MIEPTRINEQEPIFSCLCNEPGVQTIRFVYPMTLSPQNMKRFWELASHYKVLFGDEVNGDFKKFAEILISREGDNLSSNGLFWRIDDFVGIFYMTHIQMNDAQIHYSFFDRRHKGRVDITRMMIKYVFEKYGFRRLSAEIPYSVIKMNKPNEGETGKDYRSGPFEFVKQVGLKEEGRKRKAVMHDNEWFDVACMGVLKEEAEQWN